MIIAVTLQSISPGIEEGNPFPFSRNYQYNQRDCHAHSVPSPGRSYLDLKLVNVPKQYCHASSNSGIYTPIVTNQEVINYQLFCP